MYITTVMTNNGLLSVKFEERLEHEILRYSADQVYDRSTGTVAWSFRNETPFKANLPADIKERMQKAVDILVKEF